MKKEYIVTTSCIALVDSLKTLREKLQENSPKKKSTTMSSRHLQSSGLSYTILREPKQGLTIKHMLPLNIAKLFY